MDASLGIDEKKRRKNFRKENNWPDKKQKKIHRF